MREAQQRRWSNQTERGRYSEMFSKEKHPQWNPDREYRSKYLERVRTNRTAIREMLILASPIKKNQVENRLGYTAEDFRNHIERLWKPGMVWGNYGKGPGKWSIDHIKPLVDWDTAEPIIVSALHNLQPLWNEENSKKNGKRERN
jgi:predicted HTH transcriptional regulator